MKRNNKKLYESIMKDVSKTVKKHLNENVITDSYNLTPLENELSSKLYKLENKIINLGLDNEFLKERLDIPEYKNNLHAALGILTENYIIEFIDRNHINFNDLSEELIENIDEESLGSYLLWDYQDYNSIFKAEIKTFFNDDLNCGLSYNQFKKIGSAGFFILVNISIDDDCNMYIKDIFVKQRKNLVIDNRFRKIIGIK